MAKTSKVVSQKRGKKFKVQDYSRCAVSGRPHSVYKKFGISRIVLREMAYRGEIPGMKKSSW